MFKTRRLLWGATAVSLFILTLTQFAKAQETPTPQSPDPTPTIDRLAAPPTVPSPTQADEGAQLFWLYCQPCHGDHGQGLTDEWRSQFPEEEQNCWQSGCHSKHGKDKVEFGFVLPTAVPPVTGSDSLPTYETLGQLYYYIRGAMPYEMPGRLTDEEYLAIVAHLAQAHNVWDGTPLNVDSVLQVRLKPLSEKPQTNLADVRDPLQISPKSPPASINYATYLLWGSIVVSIAGGLWLWQRQAKV